MQSISSCPLTTLDGFYITGGDAEIGGGINTNIDGRNYTIQNCVIYNNKARIYTGGGMINYGKDVKLINVLFKENIGGQSGAGALDNRGNNLFLSNVDFIDNAAIDKKYADGGAFANEGDNVHLQNVIFIGNTASVDSGSVSGGALKNLGDNMLLQNVQFENNTADQLTSFDESKKFADSAGKNLTFIEYKGLYHECHNEPEKAEVLQNMLKWCNNLIG